MKNIKYFLTIMMGITIFANCVCDDGMVSEPEQDMPEFIIIEADSEVILAAAFHGCFHGNNTQACQFYIRVIEEISEIRIGDLSRKIFEQDQKIASQEDKIDKQEKIIEQFRAQEKRRAERRICKKKMEKDSKETGNARSTTGLK